MKICAISPLESASTQEILDFISKCDHDLIVLPGNALNHPTHRQVAKILNPKVSAFVETGSGKGNSTPWLVSKKLQIKMPRQVFATNPKVCDLDELQNIWPKRTHKISNHKVSFAICGEIDAFTKKATVKAGRKLPYDILVNPTHTTRGRWNHLGVKLQALSSGTVVVHVANNDYDHQKITTNVRIYLNEKLLGRQHKRKIAWSECEL